MSPCIGEEHTKRRLVVREPRLNCAYADPTVRLAECPNPDEGRKKQARVLEECDILGPIATRPLCSIGACVADDPSCARMDAAKRPAKRVA